MWNDTKMYSNSLQGIKIDSSRYLPKYPLFLPENMSCRNTYLIHPCTDSANNQTLVVKSMDNAVYWINFCPADNVLHFVPLGYHYPAFIQLDPEPFPEHKEAKFCCQAQAGS